MSKFRKLLIVISILIAFVLVPASLINLYVLAMGFRMPLGYFKGMKEVETEEGITFKIPEDWILKQDSDVLHITDKFGENYYLIGIIEQGWGGEKLDELFEFLHDAEFVRLVTQRGSISGERYGVYQYKINDSIVNIHRISFYVYGMGEAAYNVVFVTPDGFDDEDVLAKISRSRIPEMEFPTLLVVLFAVEIVIIVLIVKLKRKKND